MNKQIIFAVLLVTLASVQAKYDIRYALPEQMLQFLKQRTSAFSEVSLTNCTDSVQLKLEGVDRALYFRNGTADVKDINEIVVMVHFGIDYGSIDMSGQFTATVNNKKYRGTLQLIQLDNSSIYFDVYYNNRTQKSMVSVEFYNARKYIHSLSWDDCDLYNSKDDCFKAEEAIIKLVKKQLPGVLEPKIRRAVLNHGSRFQYKESPDVTDMPTTTPGYPTTVTRTTPRCIGPLNIRPPTARR